MVWVHLDGPGGLRLHVKPDFHSDLEYSQGGCFAPCDRWLPSAAWYYLTAPGRRASKTFSLLEAPGHHETIHARGGSVALCALGIVGLSVGTLSAASGLSAVVFFTLGDLVFAGGADLKTDWGVYAIGGGMFVAGLALGILGYLATDDGLHMLVTQDGFGQAPPAGRATSVAVLSDRTMLLQDSRTSAVGGETGRFLPAIGIPLLNATF